MTTYTLKQFVDDLDAITAKESDPTVITAKAAPLLARLCLNPDAIPAECRTAPAGQRGRYMLHRAPRFNVTSVIWRPGDEAGAPPPQNCGAVPTLAPPHDEIHAMYTPTKRDTVEIHVYGKDLAGLQRHTFDKDGTVKALVSSKYMNC